MTPAGVWFGLLAVTAIAGAGQILCRYRHKEKLRGLAQQWGMHFSTDDRFKLRHRMLNPLPQPGAADLAIADVLFATHHHRHIYLFTVAYSLGALHGVRRLVRVAAVAELVRRGPLDESVPVQIILADAQLPLRQQYQALHEQLAA